MFGIFKKKSIKKYEKEIEDIVKSMNDVNKYGSMISYSGLSSILTSIPNPLSFSEQIAEEQKQYERAKASIDKYNSLDPLTKTMVEDICSFLSKSYGNMSLGNKLELCTIVEKHLFSKKVDKILGE